MEVNQKLLLEQKQILAPVLQQSLQILSMNNLQLNEFIALQLIENPVLELQDPENNENDSRHTLFHPDFHYTGKKTVSNQSDFDDSDIPDKQMETLEDCLKEQLDITKLSKRQYRLALHIIRQIDERGYLCAATEKICSTSGASIQEVENCLRMIQSMEPAGVGARNLIECLELQLLLSGRGDTHMFEIIRCHLEDVARGHLSKIARELHISKSRVHQLVEIIKTLNPYPGSCFTEKSTQYIIPDVIVKKADIGFEISLNDKWIRMPVVSEHYEIPAESCKSPELARYLNEKNQQAKYIVRGIEQRKKTIFSVMEIILREQQNFFQGNGNLSSLTMHSIASALGVHESTVCRVVKDKYVQCDRGTFQMRYFFTREVSGNSCVPVTANLNAKDAIEKLIRNEKAKFPLSDLDISVQLKEMGISISRRTVAKYREQIGIKNAFLRKSC